jgi:hypothetical protein
LELPPLTGRFLGANVPIGGGGYLRLLPVHAVGWVLRTWGRTNGPGMLYLHPWELDPDQPHLPMTALNRFRQRVGLGRTARKLRWLLDRFRFCDVRSSLAGVEAAALPAFDYG